MMRKLRTPVLRALAPSQGLKAQDENFPSSPDQYVGHLAHSLYVITAGLIVKDGRRPPPPPFI